MEPSRRNFIEQVRHDRNSRILSLRFSWRRCFTWLGSVVLFCALATVALSISLGYRLDFANGRLEQTGLIEIQGPLAGIPVRVTLNNKEVAQQLPVKLLDVVPGTYTVELTRPGYLPWRTSITLAVNQRALLSPVFLTYSTLEPHIVSTITPTDARFSNQNNRDLEIRSNNELWVKGEFITRTSANLSNPYWLTPYHIVTVQSGTDLLFVDPTALTTPATQSVSVFPSSTPLPYFIEEGGRIVVYKTDAGVWQVELYEHTSLLDFLY
jgi:hypothetical protein